ncbi:MAG: hypothetical protein DLM69_03665 [Candidatus Chloroheliales bacterium]|nr:MAG: hypothetical protein DLM69_03665 [Chloroflexota bacterium]
MSSPNQVAEGKADSLVKPVESVLRNRNFLRLWIAQAVSMSAQNMINYILIAQVSAITNGSAVAVSGVILCFSIPSIIFAAIAGVFVDRTSKRRMLIITNVLRAISILGYFLTIQHPLGLPFALPVAATLPLIYVTTFAFATISQFFTPAEAATIPLLVRREQLISANAYFNLTLTVAQLAGFAVLGPILVRLFGYEPLYFLIFVMYIICVGLVYFLPQKEPVRDVSKTVGFGQNVGKVVEEVKEGWSFIRSSRVVMTAIVHLSIAATLLMILAVIGPKLLIEFFAGTKMFPDPDTAAQEASKNLIYLIVPGAVGMVAGVLSVSRIAKEHNREALVNYSLLGAGVTLMLLAIANFGLGILGNTFLGHNFSTTTLLIILGVLTFGLGVMNSFIQVPSQTILQEYSPEEIRGRVFSAYQTMLNVLLIFPLLFAAVIADIIGALWTMAILAVIVIAVGAYTTLLYHRHLAMGQNPGALPPGSKPRELIEQGSLTAIGGVTDYKEVDGAKTTTAAADQLDDMTAGADPAGQDVPKE